MGDVECSNMQQLVQISIVINKQKECNDIVRSGFVCSEVFGGEQAVVLITSTHAHLAFVHHKANVCLYTMHTADFKNTCNNICKKQVLP